MPWLFPFPAQGKDIDSAGGSVTFDACGVSKAMSDCCTLPPPTCYSCDSSVGKCAADRAGSQTPGSCIATCTKPTPTPAPPTRKGRGTLGKWWLLRAKTISHIAGYS